MKYDIVLNKYRNNRIAVAIYDQEGPYATLSVNVETVQLEENEFVVNHDLLHPMFKKFLEELLLSGVFEDTGKTCNYGFCRNIPIWRMELPKM